jgi:hypothetical protein
MENKIKQVVNDGGSVASGLKEYNDCTIRALAVVAGLGYSSAHKIGKDAGRKDKKGFRSFTLIEHCRRIGINFELSKRRSISIKKFLEENPTGRFYARRRGHAFAIVDGVIQDATPHNRPLQRITSAWKLELANPLPI